VDVLLDLHNVSFGCLFGFIDGFVAKMSKHLDFIQGDNSGKKTKYFEVQSRFDSCDLGRIKWHSHWKQYIFEPCFDTIWSFDCLEDLSLFLKNLNLEHKRGERSDKFAEKINQV